DGVSCHHLPWRLFPANTQRPTRRPNRYRIVGPGVERAASHPARLCLRAGGTAPEASGIDPCLSRRRRVAPSAAADAAPKHTEEGSDIQVMLVGNGDFATR